MAAPMTAATMVAILRAMDLRVFEVGNWRTHSRNSQGAWGPVNGVMIHHTVTSGTARTVQMCRDGYPGLPGPLCHGVIAKDGGVHLVGHGRANHAGLGDSEVLRAVVAEEVLPRPTRRDTDGNSRFYGFECENLGDGKDPWPAAQLEAIERVSAAICEHHGWGERSVIGHLEWTNQKIDPRGFTMDAMRKRIGGRLRPPVAPGGLHTVVPGQTLTAIAALHPGVSWQDIAAANRDTVPDPDRIEPGMQLRIPTARSAAPKPPAPAPAPYVPPAFPSGLRPGSGVPSARGLQRALKAAGFLAKSVVEADNYGPLTQAAVNRFHAAHPAFRGAGLTYDPAIGPRGWAHLHRLAYGGK
jgi:hypothetical protein